MLKNIVEFGLEWGAYREPASSIICLLLVCQRAVVVLKNIWQQFLRTCIALIFSASLCFSGFFFSAPAGL
jgi:hypothetical protein